MSDTTDATPVDAGGDDTGIEPGVGTDPGHRTDPADAAGSMAPGGLDPSWPAPPPSAAPWTPPGQPAPPPSDDADAANAPMAGAASWSPPGSPYPPPTPGYPPPTAAYPPTGSGYPPPTPGYPAPGQGPPPPGQFPPGPPWGQPSAYPPYGYRGSVAIARNNAMAIASLVTGLVGVFVCFFPVLSLLAVVFGHVALSQIKQRAGRERGRGMAIGGLVIGYLTLLAAIGFWIVVATSDTTTVPEPDSPASITEIGSDPQLDELALQCADRDFAACDQLWLLADPGSGYASYGDSCGGRQGRDPSESDVFHQRCTDLYGSGNR